MRVRFLAVASIIAATVFIAGCSDSDTLLDAIEAELNVKIQVLHASPDAPRVDVLVDGDAVLENVDFKDGSAFIPLPDGTYDIAVNAITPGGDVPVIDLPGTALAADTAYTVVAVGFADDLLNAGARPLQELILANPDVAVGAGNARVQLVHGSPSAPEVSVFATPLGADLKQAVPLDTFEFGENSIQQEVPADSYQIRVTLPFDPLTEEPEVVFDAGEIPLADGADLVIVAVDNTTTGESPITLVVLDGENGAAEILDLATPADVRAVHASPDAPEVDVLVNDATVLSGVPFTGVSGFLDPSPAPGTYNLKIIDTATGTFEALNINPTFAAGVQYTAVALGLANDIQVDSKILEDDNRSVVTEAKIRVLHGAPSTGAVDIFLTDGPSDINITGLTPTIEDVPYRDVRGYLGVAEGSYDIRVTPTGDDQTIAIDKQDIPLVAGCVYTVIARDAEGGVGPLDVILIDECAD